MQTDERDLLDVLKFELNFLEKGGYGRSPREPWRPQFIFEDSPTCMNYDSKHDPGPCTECVLMHLVPPENRDLPIPCRHIPFNAAGDTLDWLYRCSDQQEVEDTVREWLKATIAELENKRSSMSGTVPPQKPVEVQSLRPAKGRPLGQQITPKCANPACLTAFHWHEGGRFFRFRPDPASPSVFRCETGTVPVMHFWLCEKCCHKFTLVYSEGHGVVVKPSALELKLCEQPRELASPAVTWKAPH
jgi:hypothetical protein